MTMTSKFIKATAGLAALGLSAWVFERLTAEPYQGRAGIAFDTAYAKARDANVDFHIWYPADAGGRAVTVGGNGVFYGTPAGKGAPHAEGRFPMIVMSHGAGGNAGQFGWIAADLAEAGYVVVLPNHPGTTSRKASAEAAVRVWERPADITAVIDHIAAHAQDYMFIDTARIGALGFSAGGYTAMAVAGARVNPDLLQRFCDAGDHGMSDCAFLARGGVDLHAMDLSPAAQDLRDPRIQAAIIVDPGIIGTMTDESLTQIAIPMLMLNLGDEDKVPEGVYARGAADLIATAEYQIVPDATHFSFLAQCTSKGAAILAKEGEPDLLCDDAGGRDRAAIHEDLQARIIGFLDNVAWSEASPEIVVAGDAQ